MSKQPRVSSANKKAACKRCVRARWLLTLLILSTMTVILYLDQAA